MFYHLVPPPPSLLFNGFMASSHVVGTQASSREDFDVKSFVDKTHDFGRAYRHRAIELIKFCQRFLASPEQSFHQYVALSR